IGEQTALLLVDAQTSGGLLAAGEFPGHAVTTPIQAGRFTSPANRARWAAGTPSASSSAFARLRYRCTGCSQVIPIPPCNCRHSSAACTAVSAQYDWATAVLVTRSGPATARVSAAWRAVARAETISRYTSASRCLSAWNEPTGLPNWWRSLV